MRTVLAGLGSQVRSTLGDEFLATEWSRILAEFGPSEALREALKRWSEVSPKPLVLLIDEIDTLQSDPLLSALQQLRGGYPMRPGAFPQCVVLCGLRDVRDYRIHSTSSPFKHRGEVATAGGLHARGRRWPSSTSTPRRRGRRSRTTPARRYGPRPWASRGW